MTRREVAEKIFDYIRNENFTPTDIEYGNYYFVFDMGEDGVVHFGIKGLHGWKFAMWIDLESEKAVQFFCQHDINIDKFKPSRSTFLINYKADDIGSWECWGYEIIDMLRMIKRHPLVAFAIDHDGSMYYDRSYIGCYIRARLYSVKREWSKNLQYAWVRLWHGSKVWLLKRYKIVDSVEFVDQNTKDWVVNPRYYMHIHFKCLYEEDEQNERESKIYHMFFRKGYYNELHVLLSRDGVDTRYTY